MKSLILVAITSLFCTIVAGIFFIPVLKKVKVGQPILKYVETHKDKNGTPTMGGLFFIIPSVVCFFLFGGVNGRVATVGTVIGLAYMSVGFIDDFIKVKLKRNEGLKPYQKIVFQTAIAVIAGFFCFVNGITAVNLPFSDKIFDLEYFVIPIVAFLFIAVTNSVNLTDGLDGLASGVSVTYLVAMGILIALQTKGSKYLYLKIEEYQALQLLIFSLVGGILGFLVFNTSKAKVFMGDTGSLALGGFICAVSVFSLNSIFIPILGITFVASSISVIVQVAYFKKTKKRVFKMAPLHHHFQLKGVSESKISYVYALITAVMGVISLLSYM